MSSAATKPFPLDLAERMAAMRERIEQYGGCLPQDLEDSGFTPEEIDHDWPQAKAIVEFKCRVSRR